MHIAAPSANIVSNAGLFYGQDLPQLIARVNAYLAALPATTSIWDLNVAWVGGTRGFLISMLLEDGGTPGATNPQANGTAAIAWEGESPTSLYVLRASSYGLGDLRTTVYIDRLMQVGDGHRWVNLQLSGN